MILTKKRISCRQSKNEAESDELKTLESIASAMVNRVGLRKDIPSLELKEVEYKGNLGICSDDLTITLTLSLLVSLDIGDNILKPKADFLRALKGQKTTPM